MSREPLNVHFAVFNIKNEDKQKADAGFIRRFGQEIFNREILPIHKAGIMSIFNDPPNQWTTWYAEIVAFLVNDRRKNQMTWKELANIILNKMTPEQRATDVTIYNSAENEAFPVTGYRQVATEAEANAENIDDPLGGVLDDEHPYLVI